MESAIVAVFLAANRVTVTLFFLRFLGGKAQVTCISINDVISSSVAVSNCGAFPTHYAI